MCLYHPNAREKESLSGQRLFQGHSWRIAEKGESQGQKACTKLSNNIYITTCVGGLQGKNQEKCFHQKTIYSIFSVRHNWNFNGNWLLRSNVTEKYRFLAANTQDGVGEHRDKKYPMCTMTFIVFLMLWAYIFCWRVLGILFRDMESLILSNTNRYKNKK